MLSLPSLNLAFADPDLQSCANANCTVRGIPSFNCSDGRTVLQNASACSDLCANASQGAECARSNDNSCIHVLCDGGNCTDREPFVPASCNDNNPCTIDSCDVCANNCSGSCVNTESNSSSCHLAPGDPCFANGQCTTDFCVDGVCCDTACTGGLESCIVPGSLGHCIPHAPAPLLSGQGIAIAVFLLTMVGGLGLRRALRGAR